MHAAAATPGSILQQYAHAFCGQAARMQSSLQKCAHAGSGHHASGVRIRGWGHVLTTYELLPCMHGMSSLQVHPTEVAYPLRPEVVESAFVLWAASQEPRYLRTAQGILDTLLQRNRGPCGFCSVSNISSGARRITPQPCAHACMPRAGPRRAPGRRSGYKHCGRHLWSCRRCRVGNQPSTVATGGTCMHVQGR
jgi:hypothetical protein